MVRCLAEISDIPLDAFDIVLKKEDSPKKMYVNGHSRVEKNMLFLAKKLNCSDTSNFIMIDDKSQYVTNITNSNNITVKEYKLNIDISSFLSFYKCGIIDRLRLENDIIEDMNSNYIYDPIDPIEDNELFDVIEILKEKFIPKKPVMIRKIGSKGPGLPAKEFFKNRGISMKTKASNKKWTCKGCKNISKNKLKIEQIGPHHGKECYKYCMLTIPSLGVF